MFLFWIGFLIVVGKFTKTGKRLIGDTATHAGVGGVCCILDWINLNCEQGGSIQSNIQADMQALDLVGFGIQTAVR